MKKSLQFIIPIILLTGILITSCQKQTDFSPQISKLQSQVSALQKRCDSLSAALASSNSTVLNLSAEILILTNKQNSQKLSLDSIRTQIAGILTSIATLNTQVSQANAQITSLNTRLTQTNANVSAINAQIIVIDAQITTLNNQYASLLAQLNQILAKLNGPSSLTSGLVAYYPFSGNANDASSNGNNGIIYGALLANDRFGNANSAYSFNGKSSYIEIPYSSKYDNANYSFSFWVLSLYMSPAPGGPQVNQGVITRNTTGGPISTFGTTDNWAIFEDNGNIALATDGNNGGSNGNPNFNLVAAGGDTYSNVTSKWHHVVYTVSDTVANSYLDGNLTESEQYRLHISYKNQVTRLGLSQNTYWKAFLGSIDEFRIYNRVLTQTEITYLATH